jgi:hypothetical protein
MKTLMQTFKDDLEAVLDEGFPKIHEEGPEKIANKRGPALALFAEAVLRTRKIIAAFGGCEKCYGKGYGTETTFSGGRYFLKKNPSMRFCSCERGMQLAEIIESELV